MDSYPQQPQQNPQQQPYPQQPQPFMPPPPQAGMYQQPPQPKKRGRGCLIGGIVVVVVVLAIVITAVATNGGKASTNTGNTSSSSQSASTSEQPTTSTSSGPATFKVGQSTTLDGWTAVVNGTKTDKGDGEISVPKAGNIYFEVSVTLTNTSSKNQTASSLVFWTLKDTNGQAYTETIVTNAPRPPDGAVAAGSKLTGTLTYEIPISLKNVEIDFHPDLTSTDLAIWNLTV